jgi:hypoxanthine phosphoribosyltransferase
MSQLTAPPLETGLVGEVVIPAAAIAVRVEELARRISRDYRDKEPLLVAVLKGAWVFATDLARRLETPAQLDTIAVARYRRSPGFREVRITQDVAVPLRGRHVLIVEDIVDTGLTLHYLVQELQRREPASVAVCSLLDRPGLRLAEIPLHYVGFEVAEDFLIGYGLDYQERFRNLPDIRVLKKRAEGT